MLCILYITISWTKEDRSPQSSIIRKQYLKPVPVDTLGIVIDPESVFLTNVHYEQNGSDMTEKVLGKMLKLEDFGMRNISIQKEDDSYRIKWFDEEIGSVRRRGGNEDYGRKGAKLRNFPNRLNETAFVLGPGQSGVAHWNNRFTSYYGQSYMQYLAYFVNAESVDPDMFIRDYDFEYKQLADLF